MDTLLALGTLVLVTSTVLFVQVQMATGDYTYANLKEHALRISDLLVYSMYHPSERTPTQLNLFYGYIIGGSTEYEKEIREILQRYYDTYKVPFSVTVYEKPANDFPEPGDYGAHQVTQHSRFDFLGDTVGGTRSASHYAPLFVYDDKFYFLEVRVYEVG